MRENENKNLKILIISGVAVLWVVFIFFRYISNHLQYAVFTNLVSNILPNGIFLLFLAFLAYCLGKKTFRLIFKVEPDRDIAFIFFSALGFMVLSLGTTIICFSGILYKTTIMIFLIGLVLFSNKEIREISKKIPRIKVVFRDKYEILLGVFLIIFIMINLLFSLAPPFGLDEQQYHLTAPLRYIENHGYYLITNIGSQVNYPQNADMLYLLSMVIKDDVLAKLVNFYFGIMLIFLIVSFSRRALGTFTLLPSCIFYCSWIVFYVSSRANVELAQTFYDGISLLALILAFEDQRRKNHLIWFSAIASGFALGIKYTSLFSIIALLIIMTLYLFFRYKECLFGVIYLNLKYMLIVLILFSPWVIKNTYYFQTPFYPHRISKVLSITTGLFQKNQSSPDHDPYMDMRGNTLYKTVYPGYSLKELLLVPYNATIYGEWGRQVFDCLIPPFYLMFLPLLLLLHRRKPVIHALMLYVFIFYLFWLVIQPITRYLMPIMPAMAILTGYVIKRISEMEDIKFKLLGTTLKFIILAILTITLSHHFLMLIIRNPVSHLFGPIAESKSEFLKRNNPGGIQPLIEYINSEIPAKSKIYLLWEKRGYYLKRDYKEDTLGNILARLMSEKNDPELVVKELKEMGFTHILCDTYIPGSWFGSSYKDSMINEKAREIGRNELAFFDLMARDHFQELMKSGSIRLYKIP